MKPKNVRFSKSTRRNKKYCVDFDYGKKHYIVHFGHLDYQHYRDSTGLGLYSHQDHNDKKRRKAYRKRAGYIRNKAGELTVFDPLSANYWAFRFLW